MAGAIPNQDDFVLFMFGQAEFQRHVSDLFKVSQQSAETEVTVFIKFHAVTLSEELLLKKWLQFYYFENTYSVHGARIFHCSTYICAFASFCILLKLHFLYPSLNNHKATKDGEGKNGLRMEGYNPPPTKKKKYWRGSLIIAHFIQSHRRKWKAFKDNLNPKIHLPKVTLSCLKLPN